MREDNEDLANKAQAWYEASVNEDLTGEAQADLKILYKERKKLEGWLSDIKTQDFRESREAMAALKYQANTGYLPEQTADQNWREKRRAGGDMIHFKRYGEYPKDTYTKRLAFINNLIETKEYIKGDYKNERS